MEFNEEMLKQLEQDPSKFIETVENTEEDKTRKHDDSKEQRREREQTPPKRLKRDYASERAKMKAASRDAFVDRKIRNSDNSLGYFQRHYERPFEDNDPNKAQLYWDGFQWVTRGHSSTNTKFEVTVKPGVKVQITNIPVHLNVKALQLKEFLEDQVVYHDLVDEENKGIIRGLDIEEEKAAGVLIMKSIEDAKRIQLLDGIKLLGNTLRFSQYNDDKLGISSQSMLNNAKLSAKATAISYMAFQSVTKKDKQAYELDKQTVMQMPSRFVKVMNLSDTERARRFKEKKFFEIREDMKLEFRKIDPECKITIIDHFKEKIGSELTSCFIEFKEVKQAEQAFKQVSQKEYSGRHIKMAFLEEEVFNDCVMDTKDYLKREKSKTKKIETTED